MDGRRAGLGTINVPAETNQILNPNLDSLIGIISFYLKFIDQPGRFGSVYLLDVFLVPFSNKERCQ